MWYSGRQFVVCLLKLQIFSCAKSGGFSLNSNDFLIETLSKGICVEGGDFLAKLYLLRCNLSGYMQANRIVSFFKLTQFFYTYQQNRYTLRFCFLLICSLPLVTFSFSFCNLFFVSTDVKFKQNNDSKGCNAFWVCSTLYLQPRGVFTGLPK